MNEFNHHIRCALRKQLTYKNEELKQALRAGRPIDDLDVLHQEIHKIYRHLRRMQPSEAQPA
jgi:hypothetical protein